MGKNMKIDMLLEKYLMGFIKNRHMQDVFVNPTKKELKEVLKANYNHCRFIADAKNKNIYVFSTDNYHRDTWDGNIAPHLHDNRKMYKHASLFAGAYEGSYVMNWGFGDGYYDSGVLAEWENHPDMFDWANKYFPIGKWFDKYEDDIRRRANNEW